MARHGERLSREAALEAVAGVLECRAYPSLLTGTSRAGARSSYELDCPVAVRLAEKDRFFPPSYYASRIAQRVPGADIGVLPNLGHVPMIDDPQLIAQEIRGWTARVAGEATAVPGEDLD